jgi:hypothetical protein
MPQEMLALPICSQELTPKNVAQVKAINFMTTTLGNLDPKIKALKIPKKGGRRVSLPLN